MRRIICLALFGMLVSSEAAFSQGQHWVRRRGVVGPRFGRHPGIVHRHHYYPRSRYFDPFRYFVQDFTSGYTAPEPIVPFAPTYYFYRNDSSTIHPRLVFKDHMTYTVEDYWRVDDQLHFITSEEGGTKPVPHTVPFADLDVDATTAGLAAQGFRFVVRDEPIEQWLRHRAEHKADAPNTSRGTAADRRHSRAR